MSFNVANVVASMLIMPFMSMTMAVRIAAAMFVPVP